MHIIRIIGIFSICICLSFFVGRFLQSDVQKPKPKPSDKRVYDKNWTAKEMGIEASLAYIRDPQSDIVARNEAILSLLWRDPDRAYVELIILIENTEETEFMRSWGVQFTPDVYIAIDGERKKSRIIDCLSLCLNTSQQGESVIWIEALLAISRISHNRAKKITKDNLQILLKLGSSSVSKPLLEEIQKNSRAVVVDDKFNKGIIRKPSGEEL